MDKKILVVDSDELYIHVTTNILDRGDYKYDVCETFEKVEEFLAGDNEYSLALVDILMVKEAPVDIIDLLRKEHKIPVVLTTEEDLDLNFKLISEKNITQVLNKPVKSSELLNVVGKISNPDPATWFGLENYLVDIKQLQRIEVTKSSQIRTSIEAILNKMEEWGFNFEMKFEMDLVWQEILTNAVYHSHGYGRFKRDRIAIQLPEPYKVMVRFGCNENQFGIAVRDYRGTLTPRMVLDSLEGAIEQQNLLQQSLITGEDISDKIQDKGRGLDLIRRMTGEYYFIIDPGKSTEIIIIYDGYFEKDDSYSSLKLFELPRTTN